MVIIVVVFATFALASGDKKDEVKQAIKQLETGIEIGTVDGTELLRKAEAEGGKREAGIGSWLMKKFLKKAFKKALRKLGPKIQKIAGSGNIMRMLSKFGLGG